MICTGTEGLTALDFYLSLSGRVDHTICHGPIVYLELNERVADILLRNLSSMGLSEKIENAYISRKSQEVGVFGSCMGHWIDIVAISVETGRQNHDHTLQYVGDSIYKAVCAQAKWDHKELDNYLQSYGGVEEQEWPE